MKTPCQSEPERWVGDDPDEREEAAHECGTCPLRAECYARAIENGEEWGVWGGIDLRPGSQRRTPRRACVACGNLVPRTNGRQPRTCPGCVETKACAHCGHDFARTYQSEGAWERARFCGHRCAGLGAKVAA